MCDESSGIPSDEDGDDIVSWQPCQSFSRIDEMSIMQQPSENNIIRSSKHHRRKNLDILAPS